MRLAKASKRAGSSRCACASAASRRRASASCGVDRRSAFFASHTPRRMLLRELPGQRAGGEPRALARGCRVRDRCRRASSRLARSPDARAASRCFASAKATPSACASRLSELAGDRVAPLLHAGQPDLARLRAHLRQPLGVGLAPVRQHVAEDAEVVVPALQVPREEPQVAVVLERLLELVLRQHLRRWRACGISGSSRMFQNQPISSPGLRSSRPSTSLPARIAAIDSSRLALSRSNSGDRLVVALERLAVGAELGVRIGHRDLRLEHGGVAGVAAASSIHGTSASFGSFSAAAAQPKPSSALFACMLFRRTRSR